MNDSDAITQLRKQRETLLYQYKELNIDATDLVSMPIKEWTAIHCLGVVTGYTLAIQTLTGE
jgi:hypothetical protein